MDNAEKQTLLKEIKKNVSEKVQIGKSLSDDDIKDIITGSVFDLCREFYISMPQKQELIEKTFNAMRRLDILQPIIDDRSVTEIMINGPDCIFVENRGKVTKLDLTFESRERLEDVIQNIVSRVNRVVNEASPIVDARLQDGSRVNIVLPPIALNGPIVTIRKFPEKPMTMEQLVQYGSLTEEAAEALSRMVRAKYNIFVCGGTGSGKTTFLNALSNYIPADERIITIEDSAELQITGIQNLIKLETRNSNTEGKGEITIRDLIRASLRMRPERIVVGEVRGGEALDMLQAMNTGHDGSLSTGHGNSTEDMLGRLETMVLSGAQLPLDAIRQQIASALDIIIHLARIRDKSRRTLEISEVVGYRDGKIELNPLYVFAEESGSMDGKVVGGLKRTENRMKNTLKFKMAGISHSL